MVYVKQTWNNNDPQTPISAERLAHIETIWDEAVSYTNTTAFGNQKVFSVKSYGAVGDGVTDDTAAFAAAIADASAAGGGKVYVPHGVYGIDGNKGTQSAYNANSRGGLLLPSRVLLEGESQSASILKNIADNCTMILQIRGGDGIQIRDLTIDLDWPNKTTALPEYSSTRGEGIIFWNGTSVARNIRISDVTIKNAGHYGIGVQNVAVTNLSITNYTAQNIGGDALDIKDFTDYPKIGITVLNGYADTIGLNATIAMDEQDAAAWDLRGDVLAIGLRVVNLNSYLEADGTTPQIGNNGIRVNGALDSNAHRRGGRKARVIGGTIKSNKDAAEGSETAKRIIGVRVGDDYASVVGVVVENCFIGFRVTVTGDTTPVGSFIDDCQAINCRGASSGGIGVSLIGATAYGHNVSVLTTGCDTGLVASTIGGSGNIGFLNNVVDHTLTEATLASSNWSFYGPANLITSNVARPSKTNIQQEATIWGPTQPRLRLRSTFDGTWTSPYSDGVISFESADASGAGAGIRAEIVHRYTGATGGGSGILLRANAGAGLIDVITFNGNAININPSIVPNATNDAAAATAGVLVGGLYRNGSVLMIRVA